MAATTIPRPRYYAHSLVWNVSTLAWEAMTQTSGGGGGDASAANQVIGNASLSSINGKLPAALGANGGLKIEAVASGTAVPISAASLPLPTSAATETTLGTRLSESDFDTKVGSLTEAAPASDTASSGLNGRLQRIAQRLTSLTAVFPTTLAVNSGLKDASTLRVVLATDQPALTNKLLVTPDSVALPANQSVNVNQAAGTALDGNSGLKSAGTIRVVLATDQPALTNKLLVTPDSVALPANQSVNVNQFGGSAVATGTGASGAGIPRVTVANDSNIIVTPPTLTKGTQGVTGFSTQDLKDAGRNQCNFFHAAPIITTVAEVMQTLTG